ncbi:MAG: hypothetical protein ACREHC_05840, partial [Candidatus Levyibacteriota bacterium]
SICISLKLKQKTDFSKEVAIVLRTPLFSCLSFTENAMALEYAAKGVDSQLAYVIRLLLSKVNHLWKNRSSYNNLLGQ